MIKKIILLSCTIMICTYASEREKRFLQTEQERILQITAAEVFIAKAHRTLKTTQTSLHSNHVTSLINTLYDIATTIENSERADLANMLRTAQEHIEILKSYAIQSRL